MTDSLSRRDLFRGMLVAATATTLSQLDPRESALVVRATKKEIQAFGRITEPTPVTVGRATQQFRPAGPGDIVYANVNGTFTPIGVVSRMRMDVEAQEITMGSDPFTRHVRGLPTLTYTVIASGQVTLNLDEQRRRRT